MRLKPGEKAPTINLPAIDGTMFNMDVVKGKPFMLSFYRFASCPFCNLRVNLLSKRSGEFGEDFNLIAMFDSSLENLTRHTADHQAPFPILADETRTYYKTYGIEHSFYGMLKGMIMRFPTLMRGLFKGYLPHEIGRRFLLMPADFLVDAEGVIKKAYYGSDEGDHLDFDEVKEFSLSGKIIRSTDGV